MDHLFQFVAAGKATDVLAPHRTLDVASQQHRRDLSDLIDIVALLPPANLAPRDLRRRIERIERLRCHATPAELMRRDAEVAELELLVLADEDIERREVAMKRLAPMQLRENLQDAGNLAPRVRFITCPLSDQGRSNWHSRLVTGLQPECLFKPTSAGPDCIRRLRQCRSGWIYHGGKSRHS